MKKVAVIMGSDSDLPVVEKAIDTLKEYGIEEDDDTIIITASSAEELKRLVNDYFYNQRSNQVMTPQEKMVGQNMDFRL